MAVNIRVTLRRNETTERLIRRFNKTVKKSRLLEEYKERTAHHVKPSVKKKLKQKKARRAAAKFERRR